MRENLVTVMSVALGFTRDRTSAEDLAQEVFARVFGNLKGFRGGSSLRTWIYSIAVTQGLNAVRKRRPDTLKIDEARAVQGAETSPEQRALQAELHAAVHQAVESLPENLRSVVVLCSFENRPAEEVAGLLSIPPGTVFSRMSKAKEILRRKLARFMEPQGAGR
ncbi:MAG: sigma-70 family RNA polymerase sigma factor [Acidobacteriota bacterium]